MKNPYIFLAFEIIYQSSLKLFLKRILKPLKSVKPKIFSNFSISWGNSSWIPAYAGMTK